MSSDVTISSFIISLDIVHPNFDILTFSDFLKTNYKKDLIVINATDFIDPTGGRSSRSDARGEKKPKPDNSITIARGIKSKIDAEISKLIDSKKRHIAQQEKAKGKDPKKSKHTSEQQILFGGQIEVVFCIISFPYTPLQLKALEESGIDIGAFIALRSQVITSQLSEAMVHHKSNDKSARATAKRSLIEGADMDSTVNVGVFPPLRWAQLKPNAKTDLVFDSLITGDTHEEAFEVLQKEIGKIIRGRNQFHETFENRVFKFIPPAQLNLNLEKFKYFLKMSPGNIYDAIYYYIFNNGQNDPPPVISTTTPADPYNNMFKNLLKDISRQFVANPKRDDDEDFTNPIVTYPSIPSIFDTVYSLINWEPIEDRGLAERAVFKFYQDQDQYYCAAGHHLETLAVKANKQYMLGLPSAFYDWQNWCYFKEHVDCMDFLEEAIQNSLIVTSTLEESVGILWILTMAPVSKQIGFTKKELYCPMVIDGISEWLENVFEQKEVQEKKSRVSEKIADQIRHNKINSILPPIQQRLSNEKDPIYLLPCSHSENISLSTPYLFIKGLKVVVNRDIYYSQPSFVVNTYFNQDLSATTDCKTTNVYDGELKMMFGPSNEMTVFMDNYSIRMTEEKVVLSMINKPNILINNKGEIVFNYENTKYVVTPQGTIGKQTEDGWLWTEKNGMTYVYKNGQKLVCNNDRIQEIYNYYTKIKKYVRRDNLDVEEHDDGTIVVTFSTDFILRFSKNQNYYQLPGFPDITVKNEGFSFSVQGINFSASKNSFTGCSEKFTATLNQGSVNIKCGETVENIANDVVQAKCGDEILYTSSEGLERFGFVPSPEEPVNKKLEVVSTLWGNIVPFKDVQNDQRLLDLHKMFCPRFFAVRPDFSATEFIHKSQIPLGEENNFRVYEEEEKISADLSLDVVSLHKKDKIPLFFYKTNIPDKQARFGILKTLTIPKPKPQKPSSSRKPKKNEVIEDPADILDSAETERMIFTENRKRMSTLMEQIITQREERFLLEINPPEPEPEEPLPQPPETPSPAILIAQMQKFTEKPSKSDKFDFWSSPEALYAKPEDPNKIKPRVQEPRMHMHDLVTPEIKPDIDEPPKIEQTSPKTPEKVKMAAPLPRTSPSTPQTSTRMYRTEVSRPQTASGSHSADFMTMHIGDTGLQIVKIQNTSNEQMKYSFSQPTHPDITILTVPGVLAAGLTLTIKIRFTARKVEKVRASFTVQTNQGNIPIICSATVLQ
ncbi:hypothetical protein TVAG_074550 [Trichomonas vaginalis G3]|uniref:HYDIN/VesB/CFA65-like Ig-like domain-containing protein n=1 Tax=Trichomonas vaginalis (strain ATCC PRA-98 / G3) TaxID=412133 RepID=A2E3X2_TRIV3|nr:immunoglobulins domain-containing protein [Trichomonas vaginalis G3]EAY12627.1 hypothetical protein TVAG_074550 [Trichomonas vaginalis G3]KAI5546988.1 immunoglobulins domain-containing protein [Trichomonas vaginalis G3]|eukprot:XP_001324850.1 hypothetical protein [Trichomonas vaginalis G3]